MQLRRSQRVKVERKGESESPEEIKPEKKQVRRERTRKDEDQIKIETKSIDSDHNSEEDYSSVHQHLSKYELCLLENIRQNKAFLCFLELHQGVDWGDDGVLLFKPQSGVVGCLAFSSAQPTNLLTVSNDGSTHSMDLERALFEEVYHSDSGLKSFDFLSVDCSTLLMDGDVVIVDRRTPRMSYEWLHTLDPKCVSSVHVHPLQRQYFAAAES
ncbi:hypothetical protein P4O66_006877, partial [Electrophorus voltai]